MMLLRVSVHIRKPQSVCRCDFRICIHDAKVCSVSICVCVCGEVYTVICVFTFRTHTHTQAHTHMAAVCKRQETQRRETARWWFQTQNVFSWFRELCRSRSFVWMHSLFVPEDFPKTTSFLRWWSCVLKIALCVLFPVCPFVRPSF